MWIRKYFQSVYDMSNSLNHFFAWSNVIVILLSLQFLATEFIWIYWKIYNKHHIQSFLYFVWLALLSILALDSFRATVKCKVEIERIRFNLNSIHFQLDDQVTALEVETTLMQIKQNPIIFHANGLFNVDIKELLQIIRGILSYMIFFIQFSPKYRLCYHEGSCKNLVHLSY
ncbi:uncharacterized protein LOC116347731 [Contarinia nasturtii]|uniref:uncharacterized protein LOC116347731 n=1 Tax=Contarinia nasturtii TaxID=265458 RepID=UPI0012D39978|nr:uncharacterized protein LOC116347731 [Contarinia nasturtii]